MCKKSSQNISIIFLIPHPSCEGRVIFTLLRDAFDSFQRLLDENVIAAFWGVVPFLDSGDFFLMLLIPFFAFDAFVLEGDVADDG